MRFFGKIFAMVQIAEAMGVTLVSGIADLVLDVEWEINEPGLRIHPWFTTASGNCLFAVNEMLIRGTYPESWRTCSFRLPDGKGGWIERK